MSVLIKGMEMPKDGVYWCEIGVADDIAIITIHGEDRKSFPLVPVPEPHGDLIERNALFKKCEFVCADDDEDIRAVRYSIIENAPTVIPASGEGEA